MDDWQTIVLAILGSSTFTAVVMAIINHRKERADIRKSDADAKRTENETEQMATAYWQEQVKATIAQMKTLEDEVKSLKTAIATAQDKYERRVGSLHDQMDRLATELGRANTQLETANKTIIELRREVKDGNLIITELRNEITKLLVDKAEKEK